jgi:Glycosyl transferase family 2/Glycosyltransferase Family 4
MATSSPMPLISVVVPSYNQARFLPECLDSIFTQSYPHLEVVVMDGGSTDGSVAIIESHAPRLKFWQSQRDGGQSAAINAGMGHCSGELVTWLNSDDTFWADSLWTVARAWQAHPDHGLYVGNGFRHDQRTGCRTPFIERHMAFSRQALRFGLDSVLQPATFFLRRAWEEAGGLDPALQFCMDWDIYLRISRHYPVVLINEFLAVSREYEDTKTRSGKMGRVLEIARMIHSHTGQELTPGGLAYLLDTLLELVGGSVTGEARAQLGNALIATCKHISAEFGGGHWAPQESDTQDHVYIPLAQREVPLAPLETDDLPTLSVIVPCQDDHPLLAETLASVTLQKYPRLEILAVGTEPRESDPVHCHEVRPGLGSVGILNEGLERASGEVVGWLQPGDRLTAGALREVGRAFAEDPELDLVYANALYIDREGRPCLADQGIFHSAFCHGQWAERAGSDEEFPFTCVVPQPTVFLRRRLLEAHGFLDESFSLTPEHEFLLRVSRSVKIRKIERTQALCLLTPEDGSRWPDLLAEIYRQHRRLWPRFGSREFRLRLRDHVRNWLERKFTIPLPRLKTWAVRLLVQLSAATGVGNPERWYRERFPVPAWGPRLQLPPPRFQSVPRPRAATLGPEKTVAGRCSRTGLRFSSFFCAPALPVLPGLTPDEEREGRLLGRLMELSTVQFFACEPVTERAARNAPRVVDALCAPQSPTRVSWGTRLLDTVRRQMPLIGPRCPRQAIMQFPPVLAFASPALQEALVRQQPDFLFIGPATNPVALTLARAGLRARLVLLVHELESVRLGREADASRGFARRALARETARAHWFEQQNLPSFDGVIVSCEADRDHLAGRHGYPVERILVVPSGMDEVVIPDRPEAEPQWSEQGNGLTATLTWEERLAPLGDWLAALARLPSLRGCRGMGAAG